MTYPVRVYIMRGVTKSGRPGQPSPRVTVPLVDPPPAPASPVPDFTEKSITLTWTAVAPAETAGPPVVYNVYRANAEGAAPLNPAPLAEPHFETADISMGREDCFVLRSAQVYQNVPVESADSPAACVTPVDKFPPAAPSGLSALFPQGAVELVWEANAEPDLAGYLILRGSAAGDTLQTLTPAPVPGTTYRDATVTPGAHYVYAVVAVDRAGNRSAPSAQVEGTAR